ncbi:hypothetical protein WJX77_010400 [Trebouxia sp. C0004]
MVARWILRVHPGQQPGKQLQQLSQALEALEAESSGRWSVCVATHRRVQEESYIKTEAKAARDLSLVTFGNNTASVYLVLRNEKQLVTADQDMLTLLNRIALYKHRSTLVFEGTAYVLGDFAVKICRTILKPGEEVKGVAMDIEYVPASDAAAAHPALLEFMAALQEASTEPLSDMSVVETATAEYGLSDRDIAQHAAILYLTCASALLQVRA